MDVLVGSTKRLTCVRLGLQETIEEFSADDSAEQLQARLEALV